ncbi:MAG: efflux RND transporter periplasmic adaptor subunit [Burkholderiaceae bacterium]|nr:efflux RND transporter periplasmic adaptor subunit [Burkholderiaceae bacterium]
MSITRPATCVLSLLAAALLAGCNKPPAPPAAAAPPAAVEVAVSRAETVPVVDEFVGRVAAYRSVEVRARVEGILERRHFVEGSEVRRGDLLYTIDATPFQIALADAQADLARAQANLASARSREARLAPLVKENAISQQDYDDALTAVKQTEALLAVSSANVDRARTNLGYTRVLATESGKIGATLVPEGRLVGKGEATHLTTIDRLDKVYVNFTMADRDALVLQRELQRGTVKTGAGTSVARIFLPDGSEFERTGQLDFTDSRVNPGTGTLTLRAVMPNPRQQLLPGMVVRVLYTLASRPDTVLIPQAAVVKTPTGHIAWVVDAEHRVQRRDLVVGAWHGSDWIIDRGLGAGETVVVQGLQRLRQGAVVAPSPWPAPAAPAAAAAASR